MRLSHGNIGSRGSVHCIWVQSKLGKVLPNLPEECKFIVVTRLGANGRRMNSLKFSKQKISDVLTLLKRTDHPAWRDIKISQEHLNRWDDDVGNLADLNKDSHIVEVDDEGNPITIDNLPLQQADGLVVDEGPAPLQNSVIPRETFEAVLDLDGNHYAQAANASTLKTTLPNLVAEARLQTTTHTTHNPEDSQNSDSNTTNPNVLPPGKN